MIENTDFIFVKKADINEGLTTGTITKASLFLTKKYIFVIPHGNISVMGSFITSTTFTESKKYIKELLHTIHTISTVDFEKEMIAILPEERIFNVDQLEKLTVNVGFWIFGGVYIRRENGEIKAFGVYPRSKREKIFKFYRHKLD